MKKKLLWICHFLPWPPHGGSSQRNFNLLRQICKDYDVYKIGFTQSAHYDDETSRLDAINQIKQYCNHLEIFKIPTDDNKIAWGKLLFKNIFKSEPYSTQRFISEEFLAAFNKLLEQHQFDIVYADTVATAPLALSAKGRAKLVLNHHNVESTLLLRRASNETSLPKRWYLNHQGQKLRKLEHEVCPQFDVNLTVSELDAGELINNAPGTRCEVIANGSDIEYFTPSDDTVGYEMMYAGGGTWYPNRDAMSWFIKDIFPKIVRKEPKAIMHIIGTNPPADVVEAATKDDRIKVHGFVPDVRPYMARSSIYVVPIRVGGGTRLKIIDAFAAGKAVVSTSVGCEGIACVDDVHIQVADSPESITDAVIALFNDAGKRKKLERNARVLVEQKYSWDIIGARLREVYSEITNE